MPLPTSEPLPSQVANQSSDIERSHSMIGQALKVSLHHMFGVQTAVLCQHLGKVGGGGQGSKIDSATNKVRELQEVGLHPRKDIER